MSDTEEMRYRLGDHVLKTGPGYAKFGPHAQDGEFIELSVNDLGDLSELIAIAWQNVAGEEYKPVIISERGYVADPGVITFGPESVVAIKDAVNIAMSVPRTVRVERDCE